MATLLATNDAVDAPKTGGSFAARGIAGVDPFSWGVDGNDDFDIMLLYQGSDTSFNVTPSNPCAFFGTDPDVCGDRLSGESAGGMLTIEINTNSDYIQIYLNSGRAHREVDGGLSMSLHGRTNVESLRATLKMIRAHLAAHATEEIQREIAAEIAARAADDLAVDVSERFIVAPRAQPLCACNVYATSNEALREGESVGTA